MNEITANKRIVKLFVFVCVLSDIAYYPIIQSSSFGRNIVLLLWAGVAISIPFLKGVLLVCNDTSRSFALLYVWFLLSSLLTTIATGNNAFTNHFFRPVSIACLVFAIGYVYGENIGSAGLHKICLAYMHIMNILSFPLYFFYLRGTDIYSITYGYSYGKNEISVLLFCATVISVFLYRPRGLPSKAYRVISLFFCFLNVLMMKCRSVMFCYVVFYVLSLLFSKSISRRGKILFALAGFSMLIFFTLNKNIWNTIQTYIIFAGRESGDIDNLSSGRISQIKAGFEVFLNEPVFGVGERITLDCFYVSALANYGTGALPIISMAVAPLLWSIKHLQQREYIAHRWCFLVISVSMFLISWLEELAPFGPGTRCYIMWLMWGILMKVQSTDIMKEVEHYDEEY